MIKIGTASFTLQSTFIHIESQGGPQSFWSMLVINHKPTEYFFAVAIMLSVAFFTESPASANLVVGNPGFEDTSAAGVDTTINSFTSSSQITNGIWYVGNIASTFQTTIATPQSINPGDPGGSSVNSLVVLENSPVGGTGPVARSVFQFLDTSNIGGQWQLSFDYRRYLFPAAGNTPTGGLSVTVYGIDDDSTPGFTAASSTSLSLQGAPTGPGNAVPQLLGATTVAVDELAQFTTSSVTNQFFNQSLTIDLGAGTQYDQLLIRLGSRVRLGSNVRHNFDNFELALVSEAIPEPSTGFALASLALAGLLRRKR